MKNLEISVKLNITETTLRVHLRRIYRKLGIQAVSYTHLDVYKRQQRGTGCFGDHGLM